MIPETKRWVIADGNGKYIDLDSMSGGYPYRTDFWGARKFDDYEGACRYANMSDKAKTWKIMEIRSVIMEEVSRASDYEMELAALKKKHGVA